MKTQKQTINEMIAQIIAEARKLGYSEASLAGLYPECKAAL